MTVLTREALTEQRYQTFKGGENRIPPLAEAILRSKCCGNGVTLQKDLLPKRMRFNNGLEFVKPAGANEKWDFQRDAYSREVTAHLNAYGADAKIGVIAPPSFSLITAIGISVGHLPAGFSFTLTSRNGTIGSVVGNLYRVTTTGEICDPVYDEVTSENTNLTALTVSAFTDTATLHDDYIFVPTTPIFVAQADELTLAVASAATDTIKEADIDLTIAINYDVVIRAEF